MIASSSVSIKEAVSKAIAKAHETERGIQWQQLSSSVVAQLGLQGLD